MKKRVLIVAGCLMLLGSVLCTSIISFQGRANQKVAQPVEGADLFPSHPIENEEVGDNIYVDMNNEFINALNDYEAGKITSEEYEEICARLQKEIKKIGVDELEEEKQDYENNMEEEKDDK